MTITRHTAADLFLLLFAAFICGLIISCIYEILRSMPNLANACKYSRFPKYKPFMDNMLARSYGKVSLVLADVVLCLLFAVGVLIVSFVFNSGNFRFSAPVAMLLGYITGVYIFAKLIRFVSLNILFVFKWIFGIVLFPFAWIGQKIAYSCHLIHKKIWNVYSKRLIEKYTLQRISQIDKTTEFGLIEKYYKELLK